MDHTIRPRPCHDDVHRARCVLTYWWVSFVLRQFPVFRDRGGESLREQLLTMLAGIALAVARALPNLLLVVLIIIATRS
jgi:hypothetical protein